MAGQAIVALRISSLLFWHSSTCSPSVSSYLVDDAEVHD
jgi:hypothetical protein